MKSFISFTILLVFIGGICTGYYMHTLIHPPAQITTIQPKTETKTVRRDPPYAGTLTEREAFYRDCYYSNLEIIAEYKAPTLTVTARDDCRESKRDFTLKIAENNNYRLYAGVAIGALLAAGVFVLSR